MINRFLDYIYIAATIALTVYGQLIIKWRVGIHGALPGGGIAKITFLIRVLIDPWVLTGLTAAVLASLAWIAAMTKFELTYAYPFMSLNFVVVLLLSAWLLAEPITLANVLGVGLIIMGTIIVARG
jgi:multidrug transporter EmrE-like cation transporter